MIYAGFVLALVGCGITFLQLVNKKLESKQLLVLTGLMDTMLGFLVFGWVVWASFTRLSRPGKVCAGATMNVNEEIEPYSYEQGNFLMLMLVLFYIVPATLFITTNCGCL